MLLLDKCQVLLSISRVDFVKDAPILFLHGVQNGSWFKVGDQQEVASRFQLPEELIDVSQRHFSALEQLRTIDRKLRLPGDPSRIIRHPGDFNR